MPRWRQLGSGNYDHIRHGVEQLAASGDPRAADSDWRPAGGKLYVRGDHALFIKTDNGLVEAGSGKPAPDVMASGLKQVRLNNSVRSAINAALGSLRLFSSDAATRLQAAEAVFKSHDAAALPSLDKALAKETDPAVKHRMEQARAAALLFTPDASTQDRLAAVATLRARGDLDVREPAGVGVGQPPAVATAIGHAVTSIDRVLQLWSILQSVYYGISLGSVLLLAAAGLAITFGVMGVINMAHGEMVMLGAYVTYVVQQVMRQIRARDLRCQPAGCRSRWPSSWRAWSASPSSAA